MNRWEVVVVLLAILIAVALAVVLALSSGLSDEPRYYDRPGAAP